MSSEAKGPGGGRAERESGTAPQEAGGPAAGRGGAERARRSAPPPRSGEWETASPPPSVLYFRALVLRKADPPAGEG